MKNTFKYTVLSVFMASVLTSCEDFFNRLPLNEIVLEKFYTEENDITSVLNSCYAGIETPACIRQMAVWGEMRSDNITTTTSTGAEDLQLLKENILPTISYANWSSFYVVINRCNTVIHYAPLVQERDPNYSESEMRANIAEAKTLRALCYFYLIRAFRDVPFVTEPSIDDTQEFKVPATSFDSILGYLISDLEAVKNHAVRKFAIADNNKTRITRYSIYALLADLYLWDGNYEKSIEHCDLVIEHHKELYEEEVSRLGNNIDIELFKGIPLYSEHPLGSTRSGNMSTKIFGTMKSYESIFELNFIQNQSVSNSTISSLYGSSGTLVGGVSATPFLFENAGTGSNTVFKRTDCRYLEFMQQDNTQFAIVKYTRMSNVFDTPLASSTASPAVTATRRNNSANWIIYRLTDIVLIKAEASVQLAKISTTPQPMLQQALSLVSAVYNRANNLTALSADTLKYSTYSTVDAMDNLVLLERQRELMFEGKRWFDLLRMARRVGNNQLLIDHCIKKQKSNTSAVRLKMASKDYLYFPYREGELQVNPFLQQNPAYEMNKTTTITE